MKIAYCVQTLDVSKESGVLKKIYSQINEWESRGNTVKLFVLSPNEIPWIGIRKLDLDVIKDGNTFLERCFKLNRLFRDILNWKPDIVYLRFYMYYPVPTLEKLLASKIPVICEFNSRDLNEFKLTFSKMKFFYHRISRERVLKKINGMVHVTNEIEKDYRDFRKPSIVIGNGIDLNNFKVLPSAKNLNPRLAFIGSPNCPWHGLDKIFYLSRQFKSWIFEVIGIDAKEVNTDIPQNVNMRGYLNRQEYQAILESTDIAIGSLSLHLNLMDEGSPLKVREYLAYGIPTIIGYSDTDFFEDRPYLLELPNSSNNIKDNLEIINEFVNNWKGKRIERSGVIHLGTNFKEKTRLQFFDQILNR
jgi:hypothetical protein